MKEYIENGIRYGMLEEGDAIPEAYDYLSKQTAKWEHEAAEEKYFGMKYAPYFVPMRIRLEEPKDEPRCTWCGSKELIYEYGCEHSIEGKDCCKRVLICLVCSNARINGGTSRFYCSEHVHLYRDKDDEGTDKEPQKPEEKDAGTKALESVLDKVDKMTPEEYREEYDKIKDMPDAPEAILDYTPQAAIVRGAPPSQAFGSIQCFKASEEELMARDKRDLFNKATGEDGR